MPYQNIAPAPKAPSATGDTPRGSPIPHNTSTTLPKRRDVVRKACLPCRNKKVKCSGGQPCKQCVARDKALDECAYELAVEESLRLDNARLQKQIKELQGRLLEVQTKAVDIANLSGPVPGLYHRPADLLLVTDEQCGIAGGESFPSRTIQPALLAAAEAAVSPSSVILDSGRNPPHLVIRPDMLLSPVNQVSPSTSRLPPVTVSRPDREVMLLPLPQNSLAYELSTTYACVCPALVPPDAGQLGVQMVFNSAQLESQIELAQLNNLPDAGQVLNLCDQRLVGLKVFGIWTNLEIEDGLAAQLISRYLETDHLIFGLFDADLFLQDISTGGQNFCSAPLVAAILAWACLSYANLYPEMPLLSLVKPFYSEADRLFWGVNEFSNITLVSTAALLELIASYSGKVDEAVKYQTAGLAISKSIGLFAERGLVSVDQEEQSWEAFSRQTMCARSHTAWGFFALRSNFDLIHCSNTVQRQPLLPLPGRDPYMDPEGLLSPLPRPLFVDSAFVAGCELAVLITEITYRMYRSPDGGTYQQHMMSLEQAEMLYRRLLAWAAALPPECARGDQNTPAILVMHMRFHVAVIALFQPFIAGPLGRLRLQTFASEGSAMSVFNLSIDQLKRLVIIYRRTFEYQVNDTMTGSTGSVFLASLLCQLGPSQERNDVLERSHYFAVCISSLLNLLPRILSMQAVVTGLVAVGLSTRTITSAYAKQVMAEVLKRGGDYDLVRDNIGSIAVVNFELALSDRLSATASHTAENLRDIDSTEGSELRTDVGADIT